MIPEERALIQTPRKRQRIWNQERDKWKWHGHGLLFLQVVLLFHFTHYLALFCLTFYRFNAKNQEAGRWGPDGGKKETAEIDRT